MKDDKIKNVLEEFKKCAESPYYFATTYLKVRGPFSGEMINFYTPLNEEEFNKICKEYEKK